MITKKVIVTYLDGTKNICENAQESSGFYGGSGSEVYGLIYFDNVDRCHREFFHFSRIRSIEEIQETTESEARRLSNV